MARVSEYKKDQTFDAKDKLLGTDGQTGRTKNFPLLDVIDFYYGKIQPISKEFSNVNVMTFEHDLYKDVDFKVEEILDSVGKEYEVVVPHKVVRRDNDMDVYIYPKMNVKVTVYP